MLPKEKLLTLSIDVGESVLLALKQMDRENAKLLIVTKSNKYFSLLSIGDIQRAIIKNVSLKTPIQKILREQVRVAQSSDSYKKVKEVMEKYSAEFMPILDEDNNLVDIRFWADIFDSKEPSGKKSLDLPVVIMAGGKGTRLKPITDMIPKALVPVTDRPIIDLIIERFTEVGVNKFYVSINHKGEMITNYFDSLDQKNYSIEFIKEEKPLGTAGSLHLLNGKIKSSFFITNCDILIDQDYREIYKYHQENNNELSIVSALKHYPIAYGTLEVGKHGLLKKIEEKPELTFMVNSGMYILEPHLLNEVPKNELFHITELIEIIQKRKGRVGVFPVNESSWLDIGQWNEYNKVRKFFNK